jgi:hypothetical protein
VIVLKVEKANKGNVYNLECYQVETSKTINAEKEFVQEISIKMKPEASLFHLVSKKGLLFIVKERNKEQPRLELNDQNLE